MTVLYSELAPFPSQWLRNLTEAGHIANGVVAEGDMRQSLALEGLLEGAPQAHFFAGLGAWSYALRLAGWPDDCPVWTGSCPCQPFSTAGRRQGVEDDRHLWPDWFKLIEKHRPPVIFGEQVASPDGLKWFDAVSADLEGAGYAVGAADLCAAGVQAPHIRQRLYFVALADRKRLEGVRLLLRQRRSQPAVSQAPRGGALGVLADRVGSGLEVVGEQQQARPQCEAAERGGEAGVLVDTGGEGSGRDAGTVSGSEGAGAVEGQSARRVTDESFAPGAVGGFWGRADWLYCRDDVYRPVEPGSFPLAHGAPSRVGRVHAYGNAIVPQVAAEFIGAVIDILLEGET